MPGAAVIILLCLLLKVNGLITTDAKCLPGYEWMYSTIGQSPCDIAAELASVCVPNGQFNLDPLPAGYIYAGPFLETATTCRCSSVYYSLLSGCAYCQGGDYLEWSKYNRNCTAFYVMIYPKQIPPGVKVPGYAYQNVSDTFNVTLAQNTGGIESSSPPSSSSSISSSSSVASNSNSARDITPLIIGGAVGGIAGLGLLGLITFLLLRKRRSKNFNPSVQQTSHAGYIHPSLQQTPHAAYIPNTIAPLIPPITLLSHGSPGKAQNDPSNYSPSMNDHYRQHSPPFSVQNMTPDYTGATAQN